MRGARVCIPWGQGRVRGLRTAKDWVGDGAQGQRRRACGHTALTQKESPTQACLGWPGFPWRTSELRTASQALGDAERGGAFRAGGHAPAWLPRTGPVLSGRLGRGYRLCLGGSLQGVDTPTPPPPGPRECETISVLFLHSRPPTLPNSQIQGDPSDSLLMGVKLHDPPQRHHAACSKLLASWVQSRMGEMVWGPPAPPPRAASWPLPSSPPTAGSLLGQGSLSVFVFICFSAGSEATSPWLGSL